MPDGSDALQISVHSSLADILAEDWDGCAGEDNPFVCHAFLSAMETSGSVTAETGWLPQHLVVRGLDGEVLACAPVYLKSHSYGEYVFDHGWADAYKRAGGTYYPKLQCAVPFSPVTGPRLLAPSDKLRRVLATGLLKLAEKHGVSSAHVTFSTETECELLGYQGFLHRTGQQYHWENRDYQTFDDFLASLSSRKRKDIRKEREKAQSHGITFSVLTGEQIEPAHWDAFYEFYRSTTDRKWGQAYLNREFFHLMGKSMAVRVVLIMGFEGDRPVCGALNLLGGDTLYGRNWGTLVDAPFLHFEVCYYRAMDFAIEHGLRWVEAGAQGEHKISRGYLPRATHSAHWIANEGFRNAVENFLDHERDAVAQDMEGRSKSGPFKKTP